MAYINPLDTYAPRHRRDVAFAAQRMGVRAASRYYGVPPGTISKWVKKMQQRGYGAIPTKSSRPQSHPKTIQQEVVNRIVALRFETNGRCAEVIHELLRLEGTTVGMNTVRRTLERHYLINKRSPWKRRHVSAPRPEIVKPGDLVQMDTIHLMTSERKRIYVFTLIDLYSRWVHAWACEKANVRTALLFLYQARQKAPFLFLQLQSDHGPEWSQNFTERVKIAHRHSRVRRPNDNAHLERFNRTLQEELLDHVSRDVMMINKVLQSYLEYYNTKRLHLGINLKTPLQVINCFQAIG